MYFFNLTDYTDSRIIGQYNSKADNNDWQSMYNTAMSTKNTYLTSFNYWYSASTICVSGPCRTRIEELYNLITDYSAPNYIGSVTTAYTYTFDKFMTMMVGINSEPTYTAQNNDLTYTWTGKCFDKQIYDEYISAFNEFKCVTNELRYLLDGDDVGRCEKYSSVSDSGKTITNCGDCSVVNLDTFLTTDLPNINNVDEFRKAINSELIDVKNRQTLSSYPTVQLLYERYLGNCTDCDKTINKFTYNTMTDFINLIGKHWVDLAEQFVPATTIWGATDVYRNTVFHQQKHKYRRSNLDFTVQSLINNPFITCVTYDNIKQISYGLIRTIDYAAESTIYDVTLQVMPEVLPTSATTINFQAAAQSDETPRSNPSSPIFIDFQVGNTTQTFGNLTTAQINTIQSQSNTVTQQLISGNVFLTKKSVNYGLSSGPAHCSPMFYGKVLGYTKSLYE
jgi:hypothetical protein